MFMHEAILAYLDSFQTVRQFQVTSMLTAVVLLFSRLGINIVFGVHRV